MYIYQVSTPSKLVKNGFFSLTSLWKLNILSKSYKNGHKSNRPNHDRILLILLHFFCRYAYGKFSNSHEATIGGCFLTKNEDLGDYVVKYEMWDTAG